MMATDSESNTRIATSKIVIGVALAVAAALGVTAMTVTAKHETQVAQTHVTTPLGPDASTAQQPGMEQPASPPAEDTVASTAANTTTLPAPAAPAAPAAMSAPSAPAAGATAGKSKLSAERAEARASSASAASASKVAASAPAPASSSAQEASRAASASVDATPAPATTPALPAASDAPQTAQASDGAGSDTQITAQVKSEVATAVPNSTVDVTTANGDVALAGSVPTQDVADQARQAAMRVAGVRHVDASGLTISNQ